MRIDNGALLAHSSCNYCVIIREYREPLNLPRQEPQEYSNTAYCNSKRNSYGSEVGPIVCIHLEPYENATACLGEATDILPNTT